MEKPAEIRDKYSMQVFSFLYPETATSNKAESSWFTVTSAPAKSTDWNEVQQSFLNGAASAGGGALASLAIMGVVMGANSAYTYFTKSAPTPAPTPAE